MAKELLELRGVSLSFGGLTVVSELDLTVDEGEIVSVIGPNGAGKTTLFNLITGIYEPEAGDILLAGQSIVGLLPHQISRRGVSRTFQTLRLFLNMSVKENVMAAARGGRDRGARRAAARVLRRAIDGLPLEPARLQPLLCQPPPPRDRPRDGDEAFASAARRAGRGDESGRDP
jgi:ABC-type branched-subunit amino acid transport system ATPase component